MVHKQRYVPNVKGGRIATATAEHNEYQNNKYISCDIIFLS